MAGTTQAKKPMPTIGVDKYTFFKLLTDDEEGSTYDEAQGLPGTVEIAPTDSGETDVFDADNGAYVVDAYVDKRGHDITNADIPPEVDMAWRGLTAVNGMVQVKGDVIKAPYFAVAWRITKADGTFRYVRYVKGTYSFASAVGGKTKPSQGASEKQTAQATFTAVARDCDKICYEYIDSDKLPEGLTVAEVETGWFSDPNYQPVKSAG